MADSDGSPDNQRVTPAEEWVKGDGRRPDPTLMTDAQRQALVTAVQPLIELQTRQMAEAVLPALRLVADMAQRQLESIDFGGLAKALSQTLGSVPIETLLVEARDVDWGSVEAAIEQGPDSEAAESIDWNRILLILAVLQYIAAGAFGGAGGVNMAATFGGFGMATQAVASMISAAEEPGAEGEGARGPSDH